MRAQSERLKAIVLRRTDYGEADRVLQLLTPKGRRSVIAKGVRRERSKLAGGIELLAVCDAVIHSGHSGLGVLTGARLDVFYRHILEDYERMQFAYTAMKLIARASEQVDEPEWFTILSRVLAALDDAAIDRQLIEMWFYLQYAGALGEELNVRVDAAGRELCPEKRYSYDPGEKALRVSERGELTADHIKLLRLIQTQLPWQLARIGGTGAVSRECWQLARQHAGC